jgi:2-phosphoglycerate kinase
MKLQFDRPADLAERLRHVRWIGGSSGAGKSTIASQLAAGYGLHLYDCDIALRDYGPRLNRSGYPLTQAFIAMDMDERWVNRPPDVMFRTFHRFQGEGFDLILEDLLALPEGTPVLAEGLSLLPRLVSPLLTRPDQAVWLVPTPEFRRFAFDSRGTTWSIPRRTSNPERALANMLIRDHLFSEEVVRQATALNLPVIILDGSLDVDEARSLVAGYLGLSG